MVAGWWFVRLRVSVTTNKINRLINALVEPHIAYLTRKKQVITVAADFATQEANKAIFSYNDLTIEIGIKSCAVTDFRNEKNVGTIFEKYKKERRNYSPEDCTLLQNFLQTQHVTFNDFTPEFAVCFYPSSPEDANL